MLIVLIICEPKMKKDCSVIACISSTHPLNYLRTNSWVEKKYVQRSEQKKTLFKAHSMIMSWKSSLQVFGKRCLTEQTCGHSDQKEERRCLNSLFCFGGCGKQHGEQKKKNQDSIYWGIWDILKVASVKDIHTGTLLSCIAEPAFHPCIHL